MKMPRFAAAGSAADDDDTSEQSLMASQEELDVAAASSREGFGKVLVFILIAATANILFGYENSVVASAVNDFMGPLASQDSYNQGLLKGALSLGAMAVCPFAGLLQDGFGRRVTLIICLVIYLGCCALSATAGAYPGGFAQLMCGRIFTGMVIGIFSSTVPMYIAELSPANIRGSLVTINQVCVCVGILLGYIASTVLTPSWRPQFYCATPLAVVLLLAFTFVTPYSPRWLMTKGRKDEARAVLRNIRGNDAAADEELDAIEKTCADSREGGSKYAALFEPHIKWGVTIGVVGAIMQQWVGVNAVNGYAPNIFEGAGSTPAQAHIQTIYIGVAKLFFVVVALLLMDRVGRKPLLIIGCIGMAISSALLAFSYSLPAKAANPLAVGSLVLYMAFFEISLGPILWLLLSELYPLKVKGVAMSIGTTMTWCGRRCGSVNAQR
jgi:sugar porter (SP) family MFS transporter